MSDPIEEILRDSVPAESPPTLDARILAAARREISLRKRRRWYFGATAVAAALLVAVSLWQWLPSEDEGDRVDPVKDLRIAAAGDGWFEPDSAADYSTEDLPHRLHLASGQLRLQAKHRPLSVGLPVGEFRLNSGDATISIIGEGDPEVENLKTKVGLGAAVLSTVTLFLWIQMDDGDADLELDQGPQTENSSAEKVLPFRSLGEGRYRLVTPEPTPPAEAGGSSPTTEGVPGENAGLGEGMVRLEVVDARTEAPVAGARFRRLDWNRSQASSWKSYRRHERGYWRMLTDLENPVHRWHPVWKDRALLGEVAVDIVTDDKGIAEFANIVDGKADLLVEAEGYAGFHGSTYDLLPPQARRLRVALEPGYLIRGRLRSKDGRSFRAPEMARVLMVALDPGRDDQGLGIDIPVGRDGLFEVTIGACNQVRLEIDLEGFLPWKRTLKVETGKDIDVDLEPTSFISGVVADESGEPIPGASIRMQSNGEEFRSLITSTNREGFFRITTVGENVHLVIEKKGFARFETQSPVLNDESRPYVLTRALPGGIAGRVVDSGGRPLPNAALRLWRQGGLLGSNLDLTTNQEGRFKNSEVMPGSYRLTLPRNDEATLEKPDDSRPYFIPITVEGIEVVSGKTTDDILITVPRGGKIFGTVPPDAGRVSLLPQNEGDRIVATRSPSEGGRYRFDGIPAGTYAVVVGFGDLIKVIKVEEGGSYEVNLGESGGKLVRRVLRAGAPVAKAEVIIGQFGNGALSAKASTTDDQGRFEVEGLEIGPALVRVSSREGAATVFVASVDTSTVSQDVLWPTRKLEIDLGEIVLQPEARIEVSLDEMGGIPVGAVAPARHLRLARIPITSKTLMIPDLPAAKVKVTLINGGESRSEKLTLRKPQSKITFE